MKNTGKPYEGELHVRFDEKAEENMKSNPPLYSTRAQKSYNLLTDESSVKVIAKKLFSYRTM